MNKTFFIQLLLVVGTLAIAWRLLLGYGQKAQAIRRLGLLAFAGLAILSILFPGTWSTVARWVGVKEGPNLILYGLVVAFFSFVVTTFKRFRDMEVRYTRLARRIALDETPLPAQHPALVEPGHRVPAQGAVAADADGGALTEQAVEPS